MYKKPTISEYVVSAAQVQPVCQGCCEPALIEMEGACAVNVFPSKPTTNV